MLKGGFRVSFRFAQGWFGVGFGRLSGEKILVGLFAALNAYAPNRPLRPTPRQQSSDSKTAFCWPRGVPSMCLSNLV